MSTSPDTIVLIHGFWVTPRSWEDWKAHYEAKGFTVLAPAYPGYEVEVEALNADPTPIVESRVPTIIEHLEEVIASVDTPPILMGDSAGGAFMQICIDHGFGACGVAINSAPTEGVRVVPPSQLSSRTGVSSGGRSAPSRRPRVSAGTSVIPAGSRTNRPK